MPINLEKALKKYKERTKVAAQDWYDELLSTTGIIAAATSEDAQKRYEEKMKDEKVLKLRQKRLAELTDADIHNAVKAVGPDAYKKGTAAKADKWKRRFEPYAKVIDETVARLEPKGTDPLENVDKRVKPIVKALVDKKYEGLTR